MKPLSSLLAAACAALALPATAQPDFPEGVFTPRDPAAVELGWLLFYDPILSGNGEVACATCHHPKFGTGDGVSLAIGDGGIGLGPARKVDPRNPPEQRIPRNAPALFNLGAEQFKVMFHDGRLEADPDKPGGIRTPLGAEMVRGFKSVLSAQAMFPVLSADEMAGHYSENPIAQAVRLGQLTHEGGAWSQIADRVAAVPEYRARFDAVLGKGAPIGFTDIANVVADFIAVEWRSDSAPFDAYLRGEATLSEEAVAGMELFYGEAGCAECHAGRFQTDHGFHAIAMPQFGPGKAARFEDHHRDVGRMRVTGREEDAYRFRTPSLRNVTKTAPYGHTGAYATLEGVVRHHLDPVGALRAYDLSQAVLPDLPGAVDDWVLTRPEEIDAIAQANDLAPRSLSDAQVEQILAFLATLEDPQGLEGRLGVPEAVPSGLPVPR
ncbi:Cytochrome c551 peroxidase precursor [Pseudoruegeria aquimaris]|uniref:Cytochrome c551 peroxidase n=1 Tax=Pseudoruegeria aquimaris TaxID=393663 RepID=A0A1Y5TFY7_9RHOB|nr:cytochrome c peroxidase [Pseudoruegeria aquimaris]SLN60983.1 Cytochrome c551 peroxidase precursor [Pseudoruegeria aquimaris]